MIVEHRKEKTKTKCCGIALAQVVFERSRHKSLMADGSRHGLKDALYIGMGAFDECDKNRFRTHMGVMVRLAPPPSRKQDRKKCVLTHC